MAGSPAGAGGAESWASMALVGRVTRPHGLRGEVVIHPETDFVEQRFAVGAVVWMLAEGSLRELTVRTVRVQNGRPVVKFDGVERIDDAERLIGQELRIAGDRLQPLAPGSYYAHDLAGCVVERVSGGTIGTVAKVEGGGGSVRLVVASDRGEVLIPLAQAICVEIDTEARRIRVDPPEGLLELNEVRHRHDLPQDDRVGAHRRRHRPRR